MGLIILSILVSTFVVVILKRQIKSQQKILDAYSKFVNDMSPMGEHYEKKFKVQLETLEIKSDLIKKQFNELATYCNSTWYHLSLINGYWESKKEFDSFLVRWVPSSRHLFTPIGDEIERKQISKP